MSELDELHTCRSRATLHINKLEEFAEWLESKGWVRREPKSVYEALRMQFYADDGRKTLLVHKKTSADVHLTTWGISQLAVRQWLKERKQ
jgi:hypothetical protein